MRLKDLIALTFIPFTTSGKVRLNRAVRTDDAWSTLANSLDSATCCSSSSSAVAASTSYANHVVRATFSSRAYSGEAVRTASLAASTCLHRRTFSGTALASVSGLKCGRSRMPSSNRRSTPGGARRAAAVRSDRFFDCACRLPELATILIMY